MRAARRLSGADSSAPELLERLRAQLKGAQPGVRRQPLGVNPGLASVLPEPGLKPGAAYSLAADGALLHSLLAEPSQEGHWCAVVGMPTFAAEAAAMAGVQLDRLVMVPDPGESWLAVIAALAEVISVLAVRPGRRVREADAARLASRLRDRGGVLLVQGEWPRAEARLAISETRWSGLGAGFGHLTSREVTVTATSRRYPGGRTVRLELPNADGRLLPVTVASRPVTGLLAVG